MKEEYYLVKAKFVHQLINTLKDFDVNGYESMKGLVLCVMALEGIVQTETINIDKEGEEQANEVENSEEQEVSQEEEI